MKFSLVCFLVAISASATLANSCSLDQSNACVFFVADGGDHCNHATCSEEHADHCSTDTKAKCDAFLSINGVSCTFLHEAPYFACDA